MPPINPIFPSRTVLWMRFKCDGCGIVFEHQGGVQIKTQRRHFCNFRCKYDCMSKDSEYKQKLKDASDKAWTSEKRREHSKLMRDFFVEHPDKVPSISGERHWAYGKVLPWWQPWMIENPTLRKWIISIKRMFDQRCAICSDTKKLHVHHIVPVSVQPKLTYDLNNGVLLCKRCHVGKDNLTNVHRVLREDPEGYHVLMQELLLKRSHASHNVHPPDSDRCCGAVRTEAS